MKPSTLQQKAQRLLALDSRRKAHHRALSSLHASPLQTQAEHEKRGLKMWRKLRRIEKLAHDAATAQCKGDAYNGQPFLEELALGNFKTSIAVAVQSVFGGKLPTGFLYNQDPRGYALKLDGSKVQIPAGMKQDWGGYGILAAEISL